MHKFFLFFPPPGIQLVDPRGFKCAERNKRWMKGCCSHVLLYGLASRSSLISLMPCSAATVMMWSRAFMWPNIFTTSLTRSLLADMVYIRGRMNKTQNQKYDQRSYLRTLVNNYVIGRQKKSTFYNIPADGDKTEFKLPTLDKWTVM